MVNNKILFQNKFVVMVSRIENMTFIFKVIKNLEKTKTMQPLFLAPFDADKICAVIRI